MPIQITTEANDLSFLLSCLLREPYSSHGQICVIPSQNEEKRNLSLGGHVGFDSLPDQLVSKSVTQGFCFNILCVGKQLLTAHLNRSLAQCQCRDNMIL